MDDAIDNIPLVVIQDRTFQKNFYFADQNGVAIDVSSWVFASDIRHVYDDPTVIASFTFSSAGLATGNVRMSMLPATASLLPVPEATAPGVKRESKFSYDIQVTMAGGAKFTLQEGTVYVSPSVTRQ